MDTGKYYVLAEGNNLFEGMTKEQIIAAIAEATGTTPTSVDAAFITKIKEQNKNQAIKFWIGTTAEYNALEEYEPNCFYIFSDSDEMNDIIEAAENAAEAKITEAIPRNSILYENDNPPERMTDLTINDIGNYKVIVVLTGYSTSVLCYVEAQTNGYSISGVGTSPNITDSVVVSHIKLYCYADGTVTSDLSCVVQQENNAVSILDDYVKVKKIIGLI